jgi:hypothetical protein
VIDNYNSKTSAVGKALNYLVGQYSKKAGMIKSRIGGNDGMRLSVCAFASILKLQDQVSLLQNLIDCCDNIEDMDTDELQ